MASTTTSSVSSAELKALQDTLDIFSAKCQVQEETLLKKDEELRVLQARVSEYENTASRVQRVFDERYLEVCQQRDLYAGELHKKEEELQIEKIKSADKLAR